MKPNLPEALCALISDAVKESGAGVYDIEFNGPTLQVFIDTEAGVTLDVCRKASALISARLDQADLIPGRYYLEVSSPGLERKLRGIDDFRHNTGRYAHVVTNRGAWDGVIRAVTGDTVTLAVCGPNGTEQDVAVPVNEMKRSHLKVRDAELFARKG